MSMYETKAPLEGLTALKIQVDNEGRVHSFTNENATWRFVNPISVSDLVEKYAAMSEERPDELTSLEIQVDSEGQVHSFANYKATWRFLNPISVSDLIEKYQDFLANAIMEPRVSQLLEQEALDQQASKKGSFNRLFTRR